MFPCICFPQLVSDFYKIDNNSNLFINKYTIDTVSKKLSFSPRITYVRFIKQKDVSYSLNDIFCIGFKFNYSINEKLKFKSEVLNLGGTFPNSLDNYIDSLSVYPGYGEILNKGYDYSFRVTYILSKYFKFDIGRGKHFIGSGYRSLLISNESTAYPYISVSTNVWKFRYYNLYTFLSDIRDPQTKRNKYATIHYLEYAPTDYLSFGLFESVIWEGQDSTYNRGYDIEYLNPIIFYRPIEFSKNSPDNVLIGATVQFKYNTTSLYGQFVLDDLNIAMNTNRTYTGDPSSGGYFQDKYAYQIGLKSDHLFSFKNLGILIEFNQAQPYTYAHKYPLQNYTHYNQALAHPLGANFREFIFISKYRYQNWDFVFKYTNSVYGGDTLKSHYGQNIFLSDYFAQLGGIASYGNFNGQGLKTKLHNIYTDISYSLKDLNNLKVYCGLALRKKESEIIKKDDLWFFLGLRTFFYSPFQDY
ncbi:MAG: hypothetical protein VX347_03890 [Bacteroidota bacterium]|nr:hypothetical protein [Bacteroidota bacterium]